MLSIYRQRQPAFFSAGLCRLCRADSRRLPRIMGSGELPTGLRKCRTQGVVHWSWLCRTPRSRRIGFVLLTMVRSDSTARGLVVRFGKVHSLMWITFQRILPPLQPRLAASKTPAGGDDHCSCSRLSPMYRGLCARQVRHGGETAAWLACAAAARAGQWSNAGGRVFEEGSACA
jgi:hypothetical protein